MSYKYEVHYMRGIRVVESKGTNSILMALWYLIFSTNTYEPYYYKRLEMR